MHKNTDLSPQSLTNFIELVSKSSFSPEGAPNANADTASIVSSRNILK